MFFSECRRGENSFQIFRLSLAFNYFCCVQYFFDFVCFQFLPDFSLFLWIVRIIFVVGCEVYQAFFVVMFFGFLNSLWGMFSVNSNPLFISVVGYPLWCRAVCVYCVYSKCYCVRDGFYSVSGVVASEVEVLLGVCWFVVDICDDFAIHVFYDNSFRLCS